MKNLRILLCLFVALATAPAGAATQNDAGSGTDAGNTFETALPLPQRGLFQATLDDAAGDKDDYFRFDVAEGRSFSVLVVVPAMNTDPIEMLDPNGVVVDTGARVAGFGAAASGAFSAASLAFSPSNEVRHVRVTVQRAVVGGAYRLHVQTNRSSLRAYTLCVMNCDEPRSAPIGTVFGGSLRTTDTRVLLIPPSHGDLGNPLGPTVLDYIDGTLRGIRTWERALEAFAADYPEFAYLAQIDVHVEVFDGADPVDPAGYDVIVVYVAAGPAFRGVATDPDDDIENILEARGLSDVARFTGRFIALSLFGSSPRAGQVMYDFPEVNDLMNVTIHEFGHTFGLGHTTTWDPVLGPDMMNSPAPFVYGDGSPVGDGGERTGLSCLSSLDLYGMAYLYEWVPSGRWEGTGGSVELPDGIPYELYC